MKLAFISSVVTEVGRGLGVGIGDGLLIDVAAANAVAQNHRTAPKRLPIATSVKDVVSAGGEELQSLAELCQWLRELPLEDTQAAGAIRAEKDVHFHPPIPDPGKFLCVGKNYRAHLDELVRTDLIREIPDEPTGFIKLNSAMSAHGDEVARPDGIVEFDYEPELAFVIGTDCQGVSKERAEDHIFGITLFNDLTAREIQRREVKSGTRFWTAKNMPGFGPIGPYLLTLDEVEDMNALDIECFVNGERRMKLNTKDQIFKAPEIIEHFSKYIPLMAGDIFATGSAAGVAIGQENAHELFLRPGDEVDVVLPGLMKLKSRIVGYGATEVAR